MTKFVHSYQAVLYLMVLIEELMEYPDKLPLLFDAICVQIVVFLLFSAKIVFPIFTLLFPTFISPRVLVSLPSQICCHLKIQFVFLLWVGYNGSLC